ERYRDDPDQPERQDRPVAEQELGTLLAVEAPAEDGGEGEGRQADADDVFAPARQAQVERVDGQGGAVFTALPGAGNHDHQPGNGTDDDGVDEGAEHRHGTLANRVVGLGGGMGDRRAAQARFVGEHPTSHTETDGGPDRGTGKAAGGGDRVEGVMEDQGKRRGNFSRVDDQDDQAAPYIEDRHQGHQ